MGKFISAVKEECPRCSKSDLFIYKDHLPFSGKPFKMKKYCPECGLKFEKEPGFFYGSMFVSYALNVALFVTVLLIYLFLFKDHYGWIHFAVVYLAATFLMTGVIFRWSRSLWLSMFIKYDPEKRDERHLELIKTEPNIGK